MARRGKVLHRAKSFVRPSTVLRASTSLLLGRKPAGVGTAAEAEPAHVGGVASIDQPARQSSVPGAMREAAKLEKMIEDMRCFNLGEPGVGAPEVRYALRR